MTPTRSSRLTRRLTMNIACLAEFPRLYSLASLPLASFQLFYSFPSPPFLSSFEAVWSAVSSKNLSAVASSHFPFLDTVAKISAFESKRKVSS